MGFKHKADVVIFMFQNIIGLDFWFLVQHVRGLDVSSLMHTARKTLNTLKISNSSQIHQKAEVSGQMQPPKLKKQWKKRITIYQSRSSEAETSMGTGARVGKPNL